MSDISDILHLLLFSYCKTWAKRVRSRYIRARSGLARYNVIQTEAPYITIKCKESKYDRDLTQIKLNLGLNLKFYSISPHETFYLELFLRCSVWWNTYKLVISMRLRATDPSAGQTKLLLSSTQSINVYYWPVDGSSAIFIRWRYVHD